jgi:hypothetical protein
MPKKLLKFDIIHPTTFLEKKKEEWDDLDELSVTEYRERLIALRSNYSDFYTHYLNELGWEAEEFFLLDDTYINKLGKELLGPRYFTEKVKIKIKNRIRPRPKRWEGRVIQAYIKEFKPDVIFVRSQPMPSKFWQQFRDQSMLVARLSARMPHHWHPHHWDLIYTDLESFKDFFEVHNVPSKLNKQGFDPRVSADLKSHNKKHDVTFVGGMGTENFSRRTQLFEKIASEVDFKWWGYWWKYGGWGSLDDFPNLKRSFQGPTSGLDMYQIYKDTRVVLNDYVDIDIKDSIGYNQRMFEVMGVGSFMLTRQADNFEEQFPDDIFATFSDAEDCIDKIKYHLEHEEERKEIGRNARTYVTEHYNYSDIVDEFDKDLRKHLDEK